MHVFLKNLAYIIAHSVKLHCNKHSSNADAGKFFKNVPYTRNTYCYKYSKINLALIARKCVTRVCNRLHQLPLLLGRTGSCSGCPSFHYSLYYKVTFFPRPLFFGTPPRIARQRQLLISSFAGPSKTEFAIVYARQKYASRSPNWLSAHSCQNMLQKQLGNSVRSLCNCCFLNDIQRVRVKPVRLLSVTEWFKISKQFSYTQPFTRRRLLKFIYFSKNLA